MFIFLCAQIYRSSLVSRIVANRWGTYVSAHVFCSEQYLLKLIFRSLCCEFTSANFWCRYARRRMPFYVIKRTQKAPPCRWNAVAKSSYYSSFRRNSDIAPSDFFYLYSVLFQLTRIILFVYKIKVCKCLELHYLKLPFILRGFLSIFDCVYARLLCCSLRKTVLVL